MKEEPIRWLEHFLELRKRIIQALLTILIFFAILLYFANPLYHCLALPLLRSLPLGSQMIATSVTAPITVPMKFAFYLAILMAVPVLLYHAWAFVAPGLYPQEQNLIWPLIIASTILFILGMLCAYEFIFPMIFKFFANSLPKGVAMMTDISLYLNFVMGMFLAFGIIFEIPLIILIAVKNKMLSYQALRNFRPYAIVLSFIVGMLIAPPDVFSQTLLAIPMWFLYEIGLLFAKYIKVV